MSFLWLSPTRDLNLQVRTLSTSAHAFTDVTRIIDVVIPISPDHEVDENTDFNEIPYSCPAARRVVPIPSEPAGGEQTIMVIGDEHTVLYTLASSPQSPKSSRRLSSTSGPGASPRASARRSPQNEMVSSVSKRRKSSMSARAGSDVDKLEIKPVWRVRQGFGTVLA